MAPAPSIPTRSKVKAATVGAGVGSAGSGLLYPQLTTIATYIIDQLFPNTPVNVVDAGAVIVATLISVVITAGVAFVSGYQKTENT